MGREREGGREGGRERERERFSRVCESVCVRERGSQPVECFGRTIGVCSSLHSIIIRCPILSIANPVMYAS